MSVSSLENANFLSIDHAAAVRCSKSIHIQAKPEKVWSLLTNINEWPTWLTTVKNAQLNGTLKPKTTFDWNSSGLKIHSTLEVVTPYSDISWTGVVLGIHAIHTWRLEQADGGTTVYVSESMTGFLTRIFSRFFNKTLEKGMIDSLHLLKAAAEQL